MKDKTNKAINTCLISAWLVVVLTLLITYYIEVIKGERTLDYYFVFSGVTVIPAFLCLAWYLKNPYSIRIRYGFAFGYSIMYGFVLLTSNTALVFSYIFVMLVLLILYHQPSLIASVGAISMIVNGIQVAKKIQNGTYNSENSRDAEIQLVLLALSFLAAIVVTALFDKISKDNKKAERAQKEMLIQVMTAFSEALDAKDEYTSGHSHRVAVYAKEIMKRLGGNEEEQDEAYFTGLLHDVGKIRVPDAVINKPGKLTQEEFEEIKVHTEAGYQILKNVSALNDLCGAARWHHERYDGKGYPNGIKGEDIPLIARIISVADAYDAMTSTRSYRNPMAQNEVRKQIEGGMGTQFDANIARIMLEMMDEDKEYKLRELDEDFRKRILLADDNPEGSVEIIEMLHNDKHYEILSVNNGKSCIDMLKDQYFDLLIIDLEMPGENDMDGYDVVEWVRSNNMSIPVIFMKGDKEMTSILRAESFGISGYLTKPVSEVALRDLLRSTLRPADIQTDNLKS